jgi:hypothetical protein
MHPKIEAARNALAMTLRVDRAHKPDLWDVEGAASATALVRLASNAARNMHDTEREDIYNAANAVLDAIGEVADSLEEERRGRLAAELLLLAESVGVDLLAPAGKGAP